MIKESYTSTTRPIWAHLIIMWQLTKSRFHILFPPLFLGQVPVSFSSPTCLSFLPLSSPLIAYAPSPCLSISLLCASPSCALNVRFCTIDFPNTMWPSKCGQKRNMKKMNGWGAFCVRFWAWVCSALPALALLSGIEMKDKLMGHVALFVGPGHRPATRNY